MILAIVVVCVPCLSPHALLHFTRMLYHTLPLPVVFEGTRLVA